MLWFYEDTGKLAQSKKRQPLGIPQIMYNPKNKSALFSPTYFLKFEVNLLRYGN